MTDYWCERAWVEGGPRDRVRVTVDGGRIAGVAIGVDPGPDDVRLAGVVLPGFANAHSHAFHRALRGRTHASGGTFWSWRELMYAVAPVHNSSTGSLPAAAPTAATTARTSGSTGPRASSHAVTAAGSR